MDTKWSVLFGVVVAVVGVAKLDVDPTFWKVRESAKMSITKDDLFSFVTDPAKVPDVRAWQFSLRLQNAPRKVSILYVLDQYLYIKTNGEPSSGRWQYWSRMKEVSFCQKSKQAAFHPGPVLPPSGEGSPLASFFTVRPLK